MCAGGKKPTARSIKQDFETFFESFKIRTAWRKDFFDTLVYAVYAEHLTYGTFSIIYIIYYIFIYMYCTYVLKMASKTWKYWVFASTRSADFAVLPMYQVLTLS